MRSEWWQRWWEWTLLVWPDNGILWRCTNDINSDAIKMDEWTRRGWRQGCCNDGCCTSETPIRTIPPASIRAPLTPINSQTNRQTIFSSFQPMRRCLVHSNDFFVTMHDESFNRFDLLPSRAIWFVTFVMQIDKRIGKFDPQWELQRKVA